MTRPGTRLRALLARVCDAQTLERFVDPTLADLQVEYDDAVRRGRTWERRRVSILGNLALLRVAIVAGGLRTIGLQRNPRSDDRRALLRTLGAGAAVMLATTFVFAIVPLTAPVFRTNPRTVRLALYLVPQALPLSVPVGLTFGILWGLGRAAASRRTQAVVLALAVAASVVSFFLMAWGIPVANQAFRTALGGPTVTKGLNELTLAELRQRLEPTTPVQTSSPGDIRQVALNYHQRWALAVAPLVLTLFAVALTSRQRWGRIMPLLASGLTIFGYYNALWLARLLALADWLSPFASAWTANATFLVLTFCLTKIRPRGREYA